jgi:beta-lactamase class C
MGPRSWLATVRISIALAVSGVAGLGHAAEPLPADVKRMVDRAVLPLMTQYDVPGMAVGVAVGHRAYVFNYGVASRETGNAVTNNTLFELGSVSKTFTVTLASYAQVEGRLALSDKTSEFLPALDGTKFGDVSLLQLATHTPGGMPLQVPDDITNDDKLMSYLASWQPTYPPGTYRTYANPSIGVLGLIAAKSMRGDFTRLMERRLFPALGLERTYIDVPGTQAVNYAQGYTSTGAPIRMATGVLAAEAYGIKTTAGDLLRFVRENLGLVRLNGALEQAIAHTHTGYFRVGQLTQDLIWEQYAWPVALSELLKGNSPAVSLAALPAAPIAPPQEPREDVIINKTGSTNGFGAYVAFIPAKKLGIVLLANRNYPIAARVTAAHQVLLALAAL